MYQYKESEKQGDTNGKLQFSSGPSNDLHFQLENMNHLDLKNIKISLANAACQELAEDNRYETRSFDPLILCHARLHELLNHSVDREILWEFRSRPQLLISSHRVWP